MKPTEFYERLEVRGLSLTDVQKEQFHRYFELLGEWNERMNLTGITDEEGVYGKHFYDSLDPFLDMDMTNLQTVCDVGTGAGFPGVPLAIAYPHLQVYLVDSLNKRIDFLKHVADEIGLTNVFAYHARAEEFCVDRREFFDVVTSRAVARLNILMELCGPLIKQGGLFVVLKGPAGDEELVEAKSGLRILGLQVLESKSASLDIGERINIYMRKVSPTPKKYPRQFGQIKKKPL